MCTARYVVELGVCTQLAMSCRYVVELGVCTQLTMSWS